MLDRGKAQSSQNLDDDMMIAVSDYYYSSSSSSNKGASGSRLDTYLSQDLTKYTTSLSYISASIFLFLAAIAHSFPHRNKIIVFVTKY